MKIARWILILHLATGIFSISNGQEIFTNSVGMKFVLIKRGKMKVGEFRPPYPVPKDTIKGAKRPLIMAMGDGRSYSAAEFKLAQTLAEKDARPGFDVAIKKAYYIGQFEVTQGQWKKVMGYNPSTFKGENSDELPVESITWDDAQKFIASLNKLERKKKYRLPTEFEWEYAARAGNQGDISWGDINKSANLNKKTTLPVGSKSPNTWGLHDTLGNVWEWVSDYYNEKLFADPVPVKKGNQHVLKGASFAGDVKNATYMTHAAGPGNGWDVGLRVVLEK